MIIIAYIPLLIAIIGALLYVKASNTKTVEIGRLLFFSGAFVTVMSLASKTVTLLAGH